MNKFRISKSNPTKKRLYTFSVVNYFTIFIHAPFIYLSNDKTSEKMMKNILVHDTILMVPHSPKGSSSQPKLNFASKFVSAFEQTIQNLSDLS